MIFIPYSYSAGPMARNMRPCPTTFDVLHVSERGSKLVGDLFVFSRCIVDRLSDSIIKNSSRIRSSLKIGAPAFRMHVLDILNRFPVSEVGRVDAMRNIAGMRNIHHIFPMRAGGQMKSKTMCLVSNAIMNKFSVFETLSFLTTGSTYRAFPQPTFGITSFVCKGIKMASKTAKVLATVSCVKLDRAKLAWFNHGENVSWQI